MTFRRRSTRVLAVSFGGKACVIDTVASPKLPAGRRIRASGAATA
jgi:hypothetical protein